eukprot:9469173-Pyramimonas_sp.AAC.1
MSAREEEHGPLCLKNLPTKMTPSRAWMHWIRKGIHTATRLRLRNSVILTHAGAYKDLRGHPRHGSSRYDRHYVDFPRESAGGDACCGAL